MPNPLTEVGLSLLIGLATYRSGALLPPAPDHPGIRPTVQPDGTCLIEAVGYPDQAAAHTAIARAAQACVDAGLEVKTVMSTGMPARLVWRSGELAPTPSQR